MKRLIDNRRYTSHRLVRGRYKSGRNTAVKLSGPRARRG